MGNLNGVLMGFRALKCPKFAMKWATITVANASELRQAGGINAHIDRLVLRWDG